MKHTLTALCGFSMLPGLALAQTGAAKAIIERYEDYRPTAKQLAMYRLDWASSLAEALVRAKQEQRPILLVVIHAQYGDIHSGHC